MTPSHPEQEPMEAKVYDLTGRDVTDCDYCVAVQFRDWQSIDLGGLECICEDTQMTEPMEAKRCGGRGWIIMEQRPCPGCPDCERCGKCGNALIGKPRRCGNALCGAPAPPPAPEKQNPILAANKHPITDEERGYWPDPPPAPVDEGERWTIRREWIHVRDGGPRIDANVAGPDTDWVEVVPASSLDQALRERDAADKALKRLKEAVDRDALVPYNAGLTARAEAAEQLARRATETLKRVEPFLLRLKKISGGRADHEMFDEVRSTLRDLGESERWCPFASIGSVKLQAFEYPALSPAWAGWGHDVGALASRLLQAHAQRDRYAEALERIANESISFIACRIARETLDPPTPPASSEEDG